MCGVIACATPELDQATGDLIARIFYQSKIRGMHACGFSFVHERGHIETAKFFTVDDLLPVLAGVCRAHARRPLLLIGHTRYSTSGDWHDHRNNQPLALGEIALVFNGCIDMGLREEYEAKYGKSYSTENDGEIFCRKVLDGEDWQGFVVGGSFSFAGAFLHRGELTVLRNRNRPLHRGRLGDATVVASTRDILWRAGFQGDDEEVTACKAHRISF